MVVLLELVVIIFELHVVEVLGILLVFVPIEWTLELSTSLVVA